MHRLRRPVDRPLDEEVRQALRQLAAPVEAFLRPLQPALARLRPAAVVETVGRLLRIEHQPVVAAGDDDAPDLSAHAPLRHRVPSRRPGRRRRSCRGRALPDDIGRAAPHAPLHRDLGPGERLRRWRARSRRRSSAPALRASRARGRSPAAASSCADPARCRSRSRRRSSPGAGRRDRCPARCPSQPGRARAAPDTARDRGRTPPTRRRGAAAGRPAPRRRASRGGDLLREAFRRDRAVGPAERLRLLARARGPLVLVDLDRTVGERPERAVERIDPVQAQVEPFVAATGDRHHLRTAALHDAGGGAPVQVGRRARERERRARSRPRGRASGRAWSRSSVGASVTR